MRANGGRRRSCKLWMCLMGPDQLLPPLSLRPPTQTSLSGPTNPVTQPTHLSTIRSTHILLLSTVKTGRLLLLLLCSARPSEAASCQAAPVRHLPHSLKHSQPLPPLQTKRSVLWHLSGSAVMAMPVAPLSSTLLSKRTPFRCVATNALSKQGHESHSHAPIVTHSYTIAHSQTYPESHIITHQTRSHCLTHSLTHSATPSTHYHTIQHCRALLHTIMHSGAVTDCPRTIALSHPHTHGQTRFPSLSLILLAVRPRCVVTEQHQTNSELSLLSINLFLSFALLTLHGAPS